MRISVVIPAYNAADSISKAIASCMRQTHKPYQVIVVDDASNDNTGEVVMQHTGVFLITLNKNSGPSTARNEGWRAATGDIIAFLDADDEWHNEKLVTIHNVFLQNSDVLFLGHPYTLSHTPKPIPTLLEAQKKGYAAILLKNSFQPSCIAVRKTLPLRFDESYRYCEDHELAIRVAHKYSCHWLDVPLTILGRPQLSAGGASANRWKMRKGELRLYTSIYKHNMVYIVFIPVLWIYSLGKMLMRSLLH
jgi:teichuronic acid biosynthesis glycosyltransferase TuaG